MMCLGWMILESCSRAKFTSVHFDKSTLAFCPKIAPAAAKVAREGVVVDADCVRRTGGGGGVSVRITVDGSATVVSVGASFFSGEGGVFCGTQPSDANSEAISKLTSDRERFMLFGSWC